MIGVTMYLHPTQSYGSLIPGSEFIRSLVRQGTISKDAARRLRWFDYQAQCGNVWKTCRYFGITPQTFFRWKNRFDPYDLTTLESGSSRPHHVREAQTPARVVERVLKLRLQYPRWGKDKLVVLLGREGLQVRKRRTSGLGLHGRSDTQMVEGPRDPDRTLEHPSGQGGPEKTS
jgi:putative transposase